MSIVLTTFGYVSCTVHRITLYFEPQKLLDAMKMVLCMPVEYPLTQLLQEPVKKTFKGHIYVAHQMLGSFQGHVNMPLEGF